MGQAIERATRAYAENLEAFLGRTYAGQKPTTTVELASVMLDEAKVDGDEARSFARNGFSQVTAVFRDDVDLYFARQQVSERLNEAKANLPPGLDPTLGPIATGLGEIFMFMVFTGLLVTPLIQMSSIGTQITEAFAGLDRIRSMRSPALRRNPAAR